MKFSTSTLKLAVIGAMLFLAAPTSLVEQIGLRPVAAGAKEQGS